MLTDIALEKMAEYFDLEAPQAEQFIADIRQQQNEIIIKSFLMYYEANKSPVELKYLEILQAKIETNPEEGIAEFNHLFSKEAESNPELIALARSQLARHAGGILAIYVINKPKEHIREIVESLIPEHDVIKQLLDAGVLSEPI